MVNEDYSTLWEFWNSWQGTMNHAWSGGPLVIMSKHFAGITPLEAGYEKINVNPQYGMFETMNCTVPSVKGLITLDYKNVSGNYVIDLTVPEGVQTVLYVPEGADVTVNSVAYYQNGGYVGNAGFVDIIEIEN